MDGGIGDRVGRKRVAPWPVPAGITRFPHVLPRRREGPWETGTSGDREPGEKFLRRKPMTQFPRKISKKIA